MNLENLTLLFVTYNPDNNFYDRIKELSLLNYNLILFSNCKSSLKFNKILDNHYENIASFGNGSNVGLSKAYNIVCQKLYSEGFDRVLIFDQDTIILPKFHSHYSFINEFCFDNFSILQLQSYANDNKSNVDPNIGVFETNFIINSGSLVNLKTLSDIGWFNEGFFVDLVDYEYCIRSKYSGFKVGIIKGVFDLDHSTLQADSFLTFSNKTIYYRLYSLPRIKSVLYLGSQLILQCTRYFLIKEASYLLRFIFFFILKNLIGLFFYFRK